MIDRPFSHYSDADLLTARCRCAEIAMSSPPRTGSVLIAALDYEDQCRVAELIEEEKTYDTGCLGPTDPL